MRLTNLITTFLSAVLLSQPTVVSAAEKQVFAHFMLGTLPAETWDSAIASAFAAGISGFALNVPASYADALSAIHTAYTAAERSNTGFTLFLSFDFCCGAYPVDQVASWINEFKASPAQTKVDGKPFVSTFEGFDFAASWPAVRAQTGDIFVVPSWTYVGGADGVAQHLSEIDGAFNWDAWPANKGQKDTIGDTSYINALGHDDDNSNNKAFMMGVSPWMYANIFGTSYSKNWILSSDTLWFDRWEQVLDLQPDLVEVITWNDFGESHYIGSLEHGTVPDEMAHYVKGVSHEAWTAPLGYYVAAYKAGTRDVPVPEGSVGATFWYRQTRKDVCGDGDTECGVGSGIPATECVEDNVYVLTTLNEPATVSVKIGGQGQDFQVEKGARLVKMPFEGRTGDVEVTVAGKTGIGPKPITDVCPEIGRVNFNPVVGRTA